MNSSVSPGSPSMKWAPVVIPLSLVSLSASAACWKECCLFISLRVLLEVDSTPYSMIMNVWEFSFSRKSSRGSEMQSGLVAITSPTMSGESRASL